MKKFFIITLGCKLNIYESEAISFLMKSGGFVESQSYLESDVVIINTCTVTSKADAKSRNIARRVKKENPNCILILCGCLVDTDLEDLEKINEIDIFIKNRDKDKIIDAIKKYYENNSSSLDYKNNIDGSFNFSTFNMSKHSRGFVKIQDGCDNFCAYCKIPYARGANRSRNYEDIFKEVEKITENGFEEIVFTGINIGSYNYNGLNFAKMLKNLAGTFKEVRFRVGSIEPQCIDDEFCEVFKIKNICSFIHIPLQSGSDKILKLMGRKYNSEEYYSIIKKIRAAKKNPFVSADLILGFPDEQEKDFNDTFEFIKKLDLNYIHLFGFSPRAGTKAFDMKPKIPERIRDERVAIISEFVEKSNYQYRNSFVGETLETIIEKKRGGVYKGKSDNYIDLTIVTEKILEPKKKYDVLFEKINEKNENIGKI